MELQLEQRIKKLQESSLRNAKLAVENAKLAESLRKLTSEVQPLEGAPVPEVKQLSEVKSSTPEKGNAYYAQALACELGTGNTPINPKKAAVLYGLAAYAGNPDAIFKHALCYLHGRGITKNIVKAIALLKSLENTHALAQKELGSLYEAGEGVEKNIATAAEYFRLSAAGGCAEAQEKLKTSSPLSSPEVYQAARRNGSPIHAHTPRPPSPSSQSNESSSSAGPGVFSPVKDEYKIG
jgi:TPR repeat protein